MAALRESKCQEGVYGPGMYTDTGFTPMPQYCHRLLLELAANTPRFTQDKELLDGVKFVGQDLPCIPGPIKSPAMTAVLHTMADIIGHEISSFAASRRTGLPRSALIRLPSSWRLPL